MVQLAPQEVEPVTVIGGFDAKAFASLSKVGEAAIVSRKRLEAFKSYSTLAVPTARDDEWRRTDPLLFPFGKLTPPAALEQVEPGKGEAWDDEFDVVVSVGDETYSIHDRSGALKSGKVHVMSLADAAAKLPEVLERFLQGSALPEQPRKFAQMADAFWNVGLLIHVPTKTVLEKGVLVRYQHAAANGIVIPRVLVVVEDQSEARMVEHFSSGSDPFFCIGSREFYVGQNSFLKLVSALEWGNNTFHIGEDWARVGRDGKIDWVTLTLGGKVCKLMVGSDVCEPNAQAYLSGVFFADEDQHVDQRTLQLHSSPDTYSNLLYKGAVKDRGHSVYQGVINAKPGAIRVDAYQINNNLILSEGARADSLPGLEIDADDLKCSHGATCGTLDPEQLHYLRTRGLDATEATRLIVTGFFEDVVSKVPYEFLQERLREHIQVKIGS